MLFVAMQDTKMQAKQKKSSEKRRFVKLIALR
jgi:hypothetical protein